MAVSPPRSKGPPLNALRAFEAAARLGGFALAAEELCVTPGAVAQHIKSLEAWVGTDLFERRSQGVQLTRVGARVLPEFVAAFDQLGEAVQTLRARAAPKHIRIVTLPSIAELWLSPQLPAIRAAVSDVTISIIAMETPPNLKRETFDLSIFYEVGSAPSGAIELASDVLFPVCAPAVAKRLKRPSDLAELTCLHDASWSGDWALWINALMPDAPLDVRGPVYSLYSLAVEEAKNGAGVLIGHEALIRRHLDAGDLVAPFEGQVTQDRKLVMRVARSAVSNPTLDEIINRLSG